MKSHQGLKQGEDQKEMRFSDKEVAVDRLYSRDFWWASLGIDEINRKCPGHRKRAYQAPLQLSK